jgi:hypothetical protein
VSFEHGDAGKRDEGSSDGDDADGGVVTPAAERPVRTVRLSVSLASPADFAPLRRYLCEVGCQVDVLPYGSLDPRLRACF